MCGMTHSMCGMTHSMRGMTHSKCGMTHSRRQTLDSSHDCAVLLHYCAVSLLLVVNQWLFKAITPSNSMPQKEHRKGNWSHNTGNAPGTKNLAAVELNK